MPEQEGVRAVLASIYGMVQRQASLLSFVEAFRVVGILFLCCTALVLFMHKSKHEAGGRRPAAEVG